MNRTLITITLCLAIVLSNLTIAFSQTDASGNSASQSEKPINRKELESLLDKLFAEQMPKYKVPGAVISIVKDGKVIFTKGYGYADIEKKKPVDPDKTLFRAYSVSKSFTATAVMQLVEQGKLKLDEDIKLRSLFNGEYEIVLKSGAKISSSRRYRKNLDNLLKTYFILLSLPTSRISHKKHHKS